MRRARECDEEREPQMNADERRCTQMLKRGRGEEERRCVARSSSPLLLFSSSIFLHPRRMQLHHRGTHDLLILREDERRVRSYCDDEIVSARKVMLHEAERFAEEALDAIAPRRGSYFSADADAEAWMLEFV